jgi:hypothetical protein
MKRSLDISRINFLGASADHAVSLAVRSVAGLLIAFGGGFVGMIAGSLFIPSIAQGEFLPLLVRVLIIGLGTALGASLAWLTFFADRWKSGLALVCSFAGGSIGGLIAFYVAESTGDNPDTQMLIREITQATIVGAAIGSNLLPAAIGAVVPRHWRN